MSFTVNVKNEVTKQEFSKLEKISLLSAIISTGLESENKIATENNSLARLLFSLIKELLKINPTITLRKGYNYQKKMLYILKINNTDFKDILGIGDNGIPKEYIIDDEESKRSYLKGVFLMRGSINDPKKSRYHLEFSLDNREYSYFINDLLNSYKLNSKVLKRENKYMVYIKEAEKIGDFLRTIACNNAVLYYEDIRIYRDHVNMTNRLNNCEQANVDRIIETSNQQVNDIELIIKEFGLDLLDEKERLVAEYRLKYKDASLQELSEIIGIETDTNITKSGLYHRFKKITELANKLRNKEHL